MSDPASRRERFFPESQFEVLVLKLEEHSQQETGGAQGSICILVLRPLGGTSGSLTALFEVHRALGAAGVTWARETGGRWQHVAADGWHWARRMGTINGISGQVRCLLQP